ncbi:hypothetical protein D3C87_2168310 [compost metagenome]
MRLLLVQMTSSVTSFSVSSVYKALAVRVTDAPFFMTSFSSLIVRLFNTPTET